MIKTQSLLVLSLNLLMASSCLAETVQPMAAITLPTLAATLVKTAPTPNETMSPKIWEYSENPQIQFHKDEVILFNTLFPNKKFTLQNATQAEQQLKREDFLKRVFVVMASIGLKYTPEKNGQNLKDWDYPLAVALGHGQRILFDLNRQGNAEDFYNFLLTGHPQNAEGNPAQKNSITINRSYATHGMVLDKKTGQINEVKLGLKPNQLMKNTLLGLQGKHRGVNLALGGVGNLDIQGRIIGAEGHPYDPQTAKPIDEIQHGHVYIQVTDFTPNKSALLLGLESTAPGKGNMFGYSHNALSGTIIKTEKNKSATGGQKMNQLLKEKAPAVLGGMRITIDEQGFQKLQTLCAQILALPEAQQEDIFKHLLFLNAVQAKNYLQTIFP